MPATEQVAVVDLDEYRRRRQARTAAAAPSPFTGVQPMAWCYVWMMVPYGYPVTTL
jgi:hypothetical protein